VETFAALHLHIDTWRWADVPFYIRAGKNLPITATEVVVNLKRPPLPVFEAVPVVPGNYYRFRLSPDVVIGAGALVKQVGEQMRGEHVELIARHPMSGSSATRSTATPRCSRATIASRRRGGWSIRFSIRRNP
jgi:glucose-6-phosphate 1-dehydrogenase